MGIDYMGGTRGVGGKTDRGIGKRGERKRV